MAQLSDRLNRLAPSATLAMSQKSSEMKAQGIDVINMSVGSKNFKLGVSSKESWLMITSPDIHSSWLSDLQPFIAKLKRSKDGLDYTVNEVIP